MTNFYTKMLIEIRETTRIIIHEHKTKTEQEKTKNLKRD